MSNPRCPLCKAILEDDDVIDLNYDQEEIRLFVVAHCPKCNKEFSYNKRGIISKWETINISGI